MPFDLDQYKSNPVVIKYRELEVTYQKFLDHSVPFVHRRWAVFGVLLVVFFLRILFVQGWYIICYALGIYLLNIFLAFLTPKFDPSLEQEMRNESIEEGFDSNENVEAKADEFRPFIRRLPEFKFWYKAIVATSIALVGSFFSILDIPVFWPILLMYFIVLFTLTMRKQIQHMIKYRYLPFDFGKTKYNKNSK